MATRIHDVSFDGADHVVHFYEQDSELVDAVASYVAAGVAADGMVIVIATEAHREAFIMALEVVGIDTVEARAGERLVFFDAATTIAAFMRDGQVDSDAFHEVVGGLLRTAAESGRAIRAYGEMVSLLWDAGDVVGAIELETLWNELGCVLPFSLYCAYPAASVSGFEHAQALHQVCHLHSSVLGGARGTDSRAPEAASARELVAEFAAERVSPGRARRLVLRALTEWGCGPGLLQDAAVVVSELATNAVLHAASSFSLSVTLEGALLRVAVHDARPLSVTVRGGGLSPQPTHGLGLVEALSLRWGAEGTAQGKAVWAELGVPNELASDELQGFVLN
jgi:anti-sigma regulatory factor (Ser/Thr protein kinase)